MNKMQKISQKVLVVLPIAAMLAAPFAYAETELGVSAQTRVEAGDNESNDRADASTSVRTNLTERRDAREQEKSDIKTAVQDNKTELQAKRDQLKTELQTRRLSIVQKFAAQMLRVHKAALARLQKLADRTASRIAKFEAGKKVTLTDAKAKLVDARAKITVAANYISTIPGLVTVAATGTPATALQTVKGYFEISKQNLKTAQQALVDVISSIKVGMGISASTTASTSESH